MTKTVAGNASLVLVCLLMTTDCTHLVRRYGYDLDSTVMKSACNLKFVQNASLDPEQYELVGTVKLKDSGFSTRCNEMDALDILRKEACTRGADVVNIIDEERPGLSSTCYRAKAQLLKAKFNSDVQDLEIVGSHEYPVDSVSVNNRMAQDKRSLRTARLIGYGCIGAVLATILTIRIINLSR